MKNLNPFKFGRVVTGEDFVDREREIRELRRELLSGRSIILYSPRQMGKSSLIYELFRRLKNQAICAVVDLFAIGSREEFASELLGKVTSAAFGTLDRIKSSLEAFIKSLKPTILVRPNGSIEIELGRGPTPHELSEILDIPERVAEQRDKRVIIAFDEFQDIQRFDGPELEKLLRSKFQLHERASYVFLGSKRHLLDQIFVDQGGPFYGFAKIMELGPIPPKDFAKFIVEKFERSGGKISDNAVKQILEVTKGYPRYTQQLCYQLWFISKEVEDESLVELALNEVIEHERDHFLSIWDSLTSQQRGLLLGLASGEQDLYSIRFMSKHGLKSSSHVRRALSSLRKKGLVEKNQITNVFFKEWLKRMK